MQADKHKKQEKGVLILTDISNQSQAEDYLPGIVAELGSLQPKSLIFEEGMSRIFKRHPASIKRAVDRGELPPPVRMFGKNAWTVEAITGHITTRLDEAVSDREKYHAKIKRLSP